MLEEPTGGSTLRSRHRPVRRRGPGGRRRRGCHSRESERDPGGTGIEGRPPHRLAERARQPEPVHRLGELFLRDLGAAVRLPLRLRRGRTADPRPGGRVPDQGERRHLAGRQDLDDQAAAGGEVAGRPAADRGRRRVHVQLQHQERVVRLRHHDHRHRPRRGRRPVHGEDRLHAAEGGHGTALAADPPASTSGRRSAPRSSRVPTPTSPRSSAVVPSRSSSSRRAGTQDWSRTPPIGARHRRWTRSSSSPTRIPTP